ncbi:MAG: T9SS type A sorting domain-containing protein [Phycisphaerae bacterium]|nr:T9SS type A sorting domain-containing protein [Saprospiraceae bacterium]
MKNFLLLLAFAFCATSAFGQAASAKGGCTTVTVTSTPSYNPKLWMPNSFWENCTPAGDPCCRRLIAGVLGVPKYYLLRKESNGSWSTVMGPQEGTVFEITDGIAPHGIYKVRMNLPVEAPCMEGDNISYYDYNGKFAGYGGMYGFSIFTNTVIVGKTVASDNVFSFVDSDGHDSAPNGFDYQEIVKIDASGSKNYDQWWLAVLDVASGAAQSIGWQFTPAGMVNLNNVWNLPPHEEWEFWPYHSYEVRFVVENSKCQNGDGWNEQSQVFFSCPTGWGCRFDMGAKPELTISPNPTSNTLRLTNFMPTAAQEYQLTITDLAGRTVKTVQSWVNEDTDVSDLPQGMYILNLTSNDTALFSDKFVVNH